MKKSLFILILACLGFGMQAMAQRETVQFIMLADSSHQKTYVGPGQGMVILDENGKDLSLYYSKGKDWYLTIEGICGPDSTDSTRIVQKRLCLGLIEDQLDIAPQDTLYIYDGPTPSYPLLWKGNNDSKPLARSNFYITPTNTTGKVCVRFRTSLSSAGNHTGFEISVDCAKPCESIKPIVDSVYDRIDLRTGETIGHGKMRMVPENIDTIFLEIMPGVYDSTQIVGFDTTSYILGALLCLGHGVRFHGHGEYTHNSGWYNPTDEYSTFRWQMGGDTIVNVNATAPRYDGFQSTSCQEVMLSITDSNRCASTVPYKFQVRVAQNPIKTIFDLDPICTRDSLEVNVGYEGSNGTLTLRKISYAQLVTKTNEVRTFIPDGGYSSSDTVENCFEAPVTFNEFPNGKTITSASDICSICINYEHSFMADYRIAIRCPLFDFGTSRTNYQAVLKYGKKGTGSTCDPLAPDDSPDGTGAGGGRYTGWALDVTGSDRSPYLDSLLNPFGIGLDYCWSRNASYKLVTGDYADYPVRAQPGNFYISSDGYTIRPDDPTYGFNGQIGPTPTWFTNGGGTMWTYDGSQTKQPSNHEEKYNYYSPASDFSELIGCPLNGDWKAVVCDFWGADNGWIFNWSMDICGVTSGGGCEYQVGLDSVVWTPDTNVNNRNEFWRGGEYYGLHINKKRGNSSTSFISSRDTAGDFNVRINIYDEFGCVWDTLTHITSIFTPQPNLGKDTLLCSVNSIELDGGDRFSESPSANYQYLWSPFGETTREINTHTFTNSDVQYIVEVTNRGATDKTCQTRDTINVVMNDQPIPNFDPGTFPLEGCAPFTININNTTKYGYKYRWEFGDGVISNEKDPVHSYDTGHYDFKYYVESPRGCKDSLIYDNLIHVYPSPVAAFSWDPVIPTVTNPSIQLKNETTPDASSNHYFWQIQYTQDDAYRNSFHTETDHDPVFKWEAKEGQDLSGNYLVRLIARSDNMAPTGRTVTCADTVENTILLINDFLEFPSVVTPNGDGINDRFVIRNLVEGLGYPHNQLDVYDKWGSRVFHAKDICTDDQFWDPAATNTPSGTYFYRFSAKGYNGNVEHNGVIEILK